MKKHTAVRINVIVTIIIVIGFITTTYVNFRTYSHVIRDDIENISKLTSTNIYSEIKNELTKPIFVALTMANDSFLKDWLEEESENLDSEVYKDKLQKYLIGIKLKYDYNSVFAISENTSRYYHYEGVHKVIKPENEHDSWYYNFLEQDQNYALVIDVDEADDNSLTVFVNCRIVDRDGRLLGVTGVGLEMNKIQEILKTFEDRFEVEAFLINSKGVVQVHREGGIIQKTNVFDNGFMADHESVIRKSKEDMESFRHIEEGVDGYLITRYIDELDWYLVVKKDTSILKKSFEKQALLDLAIGAVVILFVVVLTTMLFKNYKEHVSVMAKIDQLTKLPNRRGFDEALNVALKNYSQYKSEFSVVIFDIDKFKKINDSKGHLFGDHVICSVGEIATEYLGKSGMLARWGGDEFSAIIYEESLEAERLAAGLVEIMRSNEAFADIEVTISLGISRVNRLDVRDTIISRADRGLYYAKENGRDQFVIGR